MELLRMRVLIVMLLGVSATQPAMSTAQSWQSLVGITSNLLIDDDRVVFAQADGSLTVLDLATGKVLARRSGKYDGRLFVAGGVLLSWNRYALQALDRISLQPRWTSKALEIWAKDDALYVLDTDGVARIAARSGEIVWRKRFEQAHSIVFSNDKLLVFRPRDQRWNAGRDAFDELGALVAVLSASDGAVTMHQEYPVSDNRIRDAYFDGTITYLARGTYENPAEDITSLDAQGSALATSVVPKDVGITSTSPFGRRRSFQLNKVVFHENGLACAPDIPCNDVHVSKHEPDESLPWPPKPPAPPYVVLRAPSGAEARYDTKHLVIPGALVSEPVVAKHMAVITSTSGVVEGVNLASMSPAWRYTFGPRWESDVFCAWGPRSYAVELNARDRATVEARDAKLARDTRSVTTHRDPQADIRFPQLTLRMWVGRITALLPIILPLLVLLFWQLVRRPTMRHEIARTFALWGPSMLLVLFVHSTEADLLRLALFSWIASIACALLVGLLSRDHRSEALLPLITTIPLVMFTMLLAFVVGPL